MPYDASYRPPLRKNGALNTLLLDPSRLLEIPGASLAERAYQHVHGQHQSFCSCGAPLTFKGFTKGYSASCGNNACRQAAIVSTMQARHGVNNSFQLEKTKQKIVQTSLEKYGVSHPMKDAEVVSLRAASNFERYGVAWPTQRAEVIKKRQANNIEKYGVSEPIQLTSVQNKIAASNFERYGVAWPSMLQDNRRKAAETRRRTELERRPGRAMFCSAEECERLYEEVPNLYLLAQQFDVGHTWLSRTFRKFGLDTLVRPPATAQLEISDLLKGLGHQVVLNDRKVITPLDIDIIVDGWLGIEINGIYWHSYDEAELNSEKKRHLSKRERCEAAGISLMMITDVEWAEKRDKIISVILTRLGHVKTIGARSCKVVELDTSAARDFCDEFHLQGFSAASIYLGLVHKGQLMMLLSAGKSRFSQHPCLEIIRVCTRSGFSVVGGFSRLLAKLPNIDLVSYCDLDKFSGKTYSSNQFVLSGVSLSYYYWHKKHGVVSRNAMQKKKLASRLENFDPALSEAENAFRNGYHRYWTSGTATFIRKSRAKL